VRTPHTALETKENCHRAFCDAYPRPAICLPQIEKAVEHAKWVDKAKIQQRKFPGLLRSLTETSKVASEQLLNRDFERHFTEECKILRAPAGQETAASP
jgi:hypothetical protein